MTLSRVISFGPLALLIACQAPAPATVVGPAPKPAAPHFALAFDLPTFAMHGDLARLRVIAEALAAEEPVEAMPAGSEELRERVRAAARGAAQASDAAGAALAVAQVAASCGACHAANGATVAEHLQVASPRMAGAATWHTDYLSWVSRLLWDGLVGPSERMWRTGAGALVGTESFPPPRAGHVPRDEVARAATYLDELGAEAVVAPDAEARADLLGRIWTVCADCHVQAGIR